MKKWIFTFGCNQALEGYCQPIYASSYGQAREKMVELHGNTWSFQYSETDWNKVKNDPNRFWELEKELEPIYCEVAHE